MNREKLLTPQEVASYLDVDRETVRRWLREGKLHGVKAGQVWRVRQQDLDRFLFEQEREED